MRRAEPGGRVLAIGIDAAETTLVRRLVAGGAMPALAALGERGRWSRVASPAWVGSGSVWPTFLTGTPPSTHGVYGEWLWDPEGMTVRRYDGRRLATFLPGLVERGVRLGLLDVPFAPFLDLADGFEVSEWGPHDVLAGRTRLAPAAVARRVQAGEPHPYSGPSTGLSPAEVAAQALQGMARRGALAADLLSETQPDLAIVVFSEIHHASHRLWHTLDSGEPPSGGPSVADLYVAVDREVGRLAGVVGEHASVVVFSLHGMRAGHGVPSLLPGVLHAAGHTHPATWRTQTWPERGLSAFAAVKRRSPAWVRRIYKQGVGHATRVSLAQPTMLAPLDWSRTEAFSLPTDQHGWVRVNLRDRERLGTVTASEYESLRGRVEAHLRSLTSDQGRPMVADVVRTAGGAGEAARNRLPDLVVHWSDGAYDDPAHVSVVEQTGQHADEGFLVAAGRAAAGVGEVVKVEELAAAVVRALPGG